MRPFSLSLVLGALLLLPAGAQELPDEPLARAGTPAPWSPRIYLMDAGGHASLEKALLGIRWPSIPATIDKLWMYQPNPEVDVWQIDIYRMRSYILAFTREAEKEQRVPAGTPRPLRILWLGSSFYGAPDAWSGPLERLAKTALIIVPAGNDTRYDASEIWTSRGLKIGFAPGGQPTGSGDLKKTIAVYLDFETIYIPTPGGGGAPLTFTSTSSNLFAGHLANVLESGVGANLTPAQIAAKLQAGFRGKDGHGVVVPEDELDTRITQVLSH
jgi:hypothetical protein